MKKTSSKRAGGMSAEYDFSAGVRGKYVEAYRCGTNVRLLDPDLVAAFPDSKSINDTLRAVIRIEGRTRANRDF
jgi:hypothetical protein